MPDLFRRLEETGQLLRVDPTVTPTMCRCATVYSDEAEKNELSAVIPSPDAEVDWL